MVAVQPIEAEPKTSTESAREAPLVFGRLNLGVAGALFAVAFLAILALQHVFHIHSHGVSLAPHYIAQAQAFLHGRWDLDMPASQSDIVVLNGGKHYIVYPPFPALLMMPFVAIFGSSMSDILFTSVISALNLSIMYLLFAQVRALGLTKRTVVENVIISVLFYFGSINLWLSLGGTMWFSAHIIAMGSALVGLLLAFRRHYMWAAVAMGCAFFSRSTAAVAFPLIIYLAWQEAGMGHDLERFAKSLWARTPDWRSIPWRRILPPLAVFGVVIGLYMVRNTIVFSSPFESGYDVLLKQRYPQVMYGPFSYHYIVADIFENFLSFPVVQYTGPFNQHPVVDMLDGGVGISVFATTPLFVLLFWRNKSFSLLRTMLWVTIGLVVVAVLLFHAAGYYQFGARYLYEAYPYAFPLMVLNEVRVDWRFLALGLFGIAINVVGAREYWTGHALHT